MPYFQPLGGGSGGATTFNQYNISFTKVGPTSYATGGFVIDLTATFSTINMFDMLIKIGTRGNVLWGRLRKVLNSPSAGKVTVVVEEFQYERVSSFDNITGQPSGVTVQTTSGQTSSSESTHAHSFDHNHGTQNSGVFTAGGAGVDTDANGGREDTHTHPVTVPAFTGTTGNGSSHNHTDNTLYDHTHTLTYTATNPSTAELANTTNLSATTFFCVASGIRA